MRYPAEQIPVTMPQILRAVGHNALGRGRRYYQAGQVIAAQYDAAQRTFSSKVAGTTTRPYAQTVVFPARQQPHSAPFTAFCSCPVATNCKHVAAALLGWLAEGGSSEASPENPLESAEAHSRESDAADETNAAQKARDEQVLLMRSALAERFGEDPTAWRTRAESTDHSADAPATPPSPHTPADSGPYAQGDLSTPAPTPGAEAAASWRRSLASALQSQDFDYRSSMLTSPAALDLHLEVPLRGALGRETAAVAPLRLTARPMKLGTRGRWIKGGLNWSKFAHRSGADLGIHPEHEEWLREVYALCQPDQQAYIPTYDWLSLDHVGSPLLWDLLERAGQLGIAVLLEGRRLEVGITPPSTLGLRIQTTGTGLDLIPAVLLDAPEETQGDRPEPLWIPASEAFPLGRPSQPQAYYALGGSAHQTYAAQARLSGIWTSLRDSPLPALNHQAADHRERTDHEVLWIDDDVEMLFAPLRETPSALARSLAASGAVHIPPEELEDFSEGFWPRLARRLPVSLDADAAEALPAVPSPELIFEVSFEEQEDAGATSSPGGSEIFPARTDWYWSYPAQALHWPGRPAPERIRVPISMGHPDPHRELRDAEHEHAVITEVRRAFPEMPLQAGRSSGWQVRHLVEQVIPTAQEIPGVTVLIHGQVPQFQPLQGDPEITVRVDSTGDRDWFGLGVSIKAGGWYVSFADVFRALDAGQKHLLLGDGTYFRLDRPEFTQLRTLIAEARELSDTGRELRLSRHQAGLWEELDELSTTSEAAAAWQEQVASLLRIKQIPAPEIPETLRASLRPYQVAGFSWLSFLYEQGLGGILADDMGLGKTLQCISLFCRARYLWEAEQRSEQGDQSTPRPCFLVVAPTSVAPNWQREVRRFAPHLRCVVIPSSSSSSGQTVMQMAAGADVVVTTYALLRLDEHGYRELAPAGLILDEAQFLKNARTKAHQAARNVPAQFKLAVTGTPLENNLMELWSMFSITAPGLFPSARKFRDSYAKPIESGEDPAALPRLRRRIRPLMLRRSKELVAADLPAKQEHRVDIALHPTHRRIYDTRLQRERQKILGLLQDMDKHRFTIFQSLTMLRRLALSPGLVEEEYAQVASAKVDYLSEQLPEIIADGHSALVFSQFTTFLQQIRQELTQRGIACLYLDGSTRNRAEVLQAFEDGAAPVFLISLKAGGFGLNLTAADYCFLMDPWWNPAVEEQAVDRAHRIGQTRQVMVCRLVSSGTIEEKVMDLKESKSKLFEAVMDDGELFSQELGSEEIQALIGE